MLGYWLGAAFVGRGLATAACAALIGHARTALCATDIWAGVTKGNERSVAVLTRLGLAPVADMGRYVRYHKAVGGPPA